jgi:uncharacterized protein YjbJ (UPF0337 family)
MDEIATTREIVMADPLAHGGKRKMGIFEDAKGRAKKAAGDIAGNPDLQKEGEAQSEKGKAEREATENRAKARAQEEKARVREGQQEASEEQK